MRARKAARPSSSSAKRSRPSISTAPALGRSRPARRPSSVDLPEPDTPTVVTASPAHTSTLMPSRIVNPVVPLGTVLPRPSTRIIFLPGSSIMLSRVFIFLVLALAPAASSAGAILVFGDSLSAGYGVPQEKTWASLLEKRLREQNFSYTVA